MKSGLTVVRLRVLFLFLVCAVVAAFPWVLSMISSPLPYALQKTATILPITRTARVDENAGHTLVARLNFTATPSFTPTSTSTPTPTDTPTPTASTTPFPSLTYTPTYTLTPTPDVYLYTLQKVNAYTCPGASFKKGALEAGLRFPVLGWDQVEEDGRQWVWILVEDVIGKAQVWVRESEFVLVSNLDYMNFVPRAACRPAP